MKKNLIKCLFLIIILMSLMACRVPNNVDIEIQTDESSRFVIIEHEHTDAYDIAYDQYTKVMYVISNSPYNRGSFTLLVDSDGNPLLYEN